MLAEINNKKTIKNIKERLNIYAIIMQSGRYSIDMRNPLWCNRLIVNDENASAGEIEYVTTITCALDKIPAIQAEIIYSIYVMKYTIEETKEYVSNTNVHRLLRKAHINLALLLGEAVFYEIQ
ncbi:hypothetical protein [[Clostridium] innocuum]|uniref:hypothetical protein n=1 Tax=Clostridium innocuum TaxID=1522 RepID=UPI001AF4D36A|nr:hypothetical protein [[Clostridium] innocuum]MDU1018797.1 hypothetical protein [Bifidobacterium breve]QSI26893.1 hypothetical protein GKZ87_16065 [Erysipelotrichaceae bacterium 66202529]MCC2831860.1 hypothetical protein [[Clostridium] innocuum]MCR0248576.1 hypothetical protein [[Clostridium] innocuum]MCR0261087.1 hypothetical protein [[Clostridium] innocuum]